VICACRAEGSDGWAPKGVSIKRVPWLMEIFDTSDRFRDSNKYCLCRPDALYSARNFKGLDQRHEMPAMRLCQ
jgi:hypothetical protein